MEEEVLEKKKQEEQKTRMIKYRDILQAQIENSSKKKLFKDVMSEFEKRVNAKELEAYVNKETKLHSKVVGIKEPLNLNNSPEKNVTAEKKQDEQKGEKEDIIRKLNGPNTQKFKMCSPEKLFSHSPPKILEAAKQNMNNPNLNYLRQSTCNRAYGYSPEKSHKSLNKSYDIYLKEMKNENSITSEKSSIDHDSSLAIAGKILIQGNEGQQKQVAEDFKIKRNITPGQAAGFAKKKGMNYNIINGKDLVSNNIHPHEKLWG